MKEVLLMAVLQGFDQLTSEGLNVDLLKSHHTRFQQAHQVMVTVLKHQVEGTFEEERERERERGEGRRGGGSEEGGREKREGGGNIG